MLMTCGSATQLSLSAVLMYVSWQLVTSEPWNHSVMEVNTSKGTLERGSCVSSSNLESSSQHLAQTLYWMILYFVIPASKCPCSFPEIRYLLLLLPPLSNLLCAVKQLHDSSQDVVAYKIPVSLLTRQASQNVRQGCSVSQPQERISEEAYLPATSWLLGLAWTPSSRFPSCPLACPAQVTPTLSSSQS